MKPASQPATWHRENLPFSQCKIYNKIIEKLVVSCDAVLFTAVRITTVIYVLFW
jgi:hypothetical protein